MIINAVFRDKRFSPNSVMADRAILDETTSRLCDLLGCDRRNMEETELAELQGNKDACTQAFVWLSMGRLPSTLDFLRKKEKAGQIVVNSPDGVAACSRSRLRLMMSSHGLPVAPAEGQHGFWLKRGDMTAQMPNDVVYAVDENEKNRLLAEFNSRGVEDIVVEAHIPGDLVKFYGVTGTGFFRFYYPTADGRWKFNNEQHNGYPNYYSFDVRRMNDIAEKVAGMTGVDVYGGDCVITSEGTIYIIDFNDWPSFSRCREEAANAIADCIALKAAGKNWK